jgi:hypothetical protein
MVFGVVFLVGWAQNVIPSVFALRANKPPQESASSRSLTLSRPTGLVATTLPAVIVGHAAASNEGIATDKTALVYRSSNRILGI